MIRREQPDKKLLGGRGPNKGRTSEAHNKSKVSTIIKNAKAVEKAMEDARADGKAATAARKDPRIISDQERKRLASQLNGLTPLEFACSMMRDPAASIPEKQWACAVLLPYLHRKMPVAIDVGGQKDNPINVKNMTSQELVSFIDLCQKAGIALPATS